MSTNWKDDTKNLFGAPPPDPEPVDDAAPDRTVGLPPPPPRRRKDPTDVPPAPIDRPSNRERVDAAADAAMPADVVSNGQDAPPAVAEHTSPAPPATATAPADTGTVDEAEAATDDIDSPSFHESTSGAASEHATIDEPVDAPASVQADATGHRPAARGRLEATTALVPMHVYEAARLQKDAAGVTWREFFVDAFDRLYPQMPSLFTPPPPRNSPMPSAAGTRRRTLRQPRQFKLTLLPQETEVLDQAVEQFHAHSRSELVTYVLAYAANQNPDEPGQPWQH